MDAAAALTQRDLEDAWSEIGLDCRAVEGELGHWQLTFSDGDGVAARLLVRHRKPDVDFIDFEVYRPKLRLSGLVSSRLPKFYRRHGYDGDFVIPRAKGEAAELFEAVGYEPDEQGGFRAPITAISRRANTYLAKAAK